VYYPQNPPVYYPQNPPTVYPQNPQPIYPQTGEKGVDLYASKSDTSNVTPVAKNNGQTDNGFSAVFYATIVAFLAVGSAAASRLIGLGL
jgi:hypothetical protein